MRLSSRTNRCAPLRPEVRGLLRDHPVCPPCRGRQRAHPDIPRHSLGPGDRAYQQMGGGPAPHHQAPAANLVLAPMTPHYTQEQIDGAHHHMCVEYPEIASGC